MRSLFALIAVAALVAVVVAQRHVIAVHVFAFVEKPTLSDALDEGPLVRWHDDRHPQRSRLGV